jgi:hypothetical protein
VPHAVYQFRSHYQLITLDSICPLEYRKSPPFEWLPDIASGHNFRYRYLYQGRAREHAFHIVACFLGSIRSVRPFESERQQKDIR